MLTNRKQLQLQSCSVRSALSADGKLLLLLVMMVVMGATVSGYGAMVTDAAQLTCSGDKSYSTT